MDKTLKKTLIKHKIIFCLIRVGHINQLLIFTYIYNVDLDDHKLRAKTHVG